MFVSAPVDLPPPPPQSDPREPSPHVNTRQRIATPSRPRSPVGSRGSSPVRPPTQRSPSSDPTALSLVQISFISYNDLLLSIPTTVTPLGDITSGTMSPDHLPGTISPNMSTRSPVVPPPVLAGPASLSPVEHKSSSSWDSGAAGRGSGLGLGEGEWERQGLGRGLEQRLEDLVHVQGKSGEGGR